ncbi:MAG: hypothetical protein ACLFPX_02340 [Candidatus Omnitrophota bacterium]
MKTYAKYTALIALALFLCFPFSASAQDTAENEPPTAVNAEQTEHMETPAPSKEPYYYGPAIFDDGMMIAGYTKKYLEEDRDTLLAMIKDETLGHLKISAAIRAFRQKFSREIFAHEKTLAERALIHRLKRADSAFIQVEAMHTLCIMDRYRYFKPYIPKLILKMDHYNDTVSQSAYHAVKESIEEGNNRPREARIVFNMLRKMLFLMRKRLAKISEADQRLIHKLELLRWSVKVLGSDELKHLPKEALNFL